MGNGRLTPAVFRGPQRMIRQDTYTYVRVFRGRRGAESQVTGFTARIAATNAATLSREQRAIIGDAAVQVYVMPAPSGADVRNNDEVWAGERRFRVLACDPLASGTQVILQQIQ